MVKLARCSYRVLVVDDNVDAARALATILEMTGYEVGLAHDGPTALQEVLDYRPKVVLLDIGPPGLDGFEVARQIRQQAVLSHVVLVALTGYGQAMDLQLSHDAGFDHHLVKPASLSDIEKILSRVSSPVV
jgi:CheY-like chemotaxis protein